MKKMEYGYDPLREEIHWTAISNVIASILWIAVVLYSTTQDLPDLIDAPDSWSPLLPVGLAVVLPGFFLTNFLLSHRAQARIRPLRASALTGDAPISLAPQPEAPQLPVELPYTVRMRINKRLLISSGIIIGLYLAFFTLVFFSSQSEGLAAQLRLISSVLYFPLLFLLSPIITLTQYRWVVPMLTFDEESITARYGDDSITMRWIDVCSFTIMGKNKPGSPTVFELSDGRHIIRWIDIYTVRSRPYDPAIKPEDYRALMQALPFWICSKTGQPLRDLRT